MPPLIGQDADLTFSEDGDKSPSQHYELIACFSFTNLHLQVALPPSNPKVDLRSSDDEMETMTQPCRLYTDLLFIH